MKKCLKLFLDLFTILQIFNYFNNHKIHSCLNYLFITFSSIFRFFFACQHNLKFYAFTSIILFALFDPCKTLISKEKLFYYEEALKTEKVSSIFSIPLYEEFLKNNPPKKYSEAVVRRLFDLYTNNNKYDDLIILTGNYNIDKIRRSRLDEILKELSKSFGISYDNFKKICNLAIKNDSDSFAELIEIFNQERNKYILNYVFAIKLKINDHISIKYLLDNLSDINPILKVIYNIKINSSKIKNSIEEAAKIHNNNNNDVRKELFYLYGLHLNKSRRFKESIRYHRMSLSYEKDLNLPYYPRSTLEISKNLYIKGYTSDACLNISEKKIIIFNESDEFMKIYCDKNRNKELKLIFPVIKFLAKKESNFIFKRFSNENNL